MTATKINARITLSRVTKTPIIGKPVTFAIKVTGKGIFNMSIALDFNRAVLTPIKVATLKGFYDVHNFDSSLAGAKIILLDIYKNGYQGLNLSSKQLASITFMYHGGSTPLQILTDLSGVWDDIGDDINPAKYTASSI